MSDDPAVSLDPPRIPDGLPVMGRERHYAVLAELALLALRETELDVVLDAAARELRAALQCDFVKVLDAHISGSGLLVRAGAGWPEGIVGHREVSEGNESQGGYTLQQARPVIVEDLPTERRFSPAPVLVEHGVRSGVSVLIPGDPAPFGVLQADSREPRRFDGSSIPVLQAYARVLGIAIQQHDREQLSAGFAAIASHELRTPLTLLIGYSSRLLRQLDAGGAIGVEQREEVELLYSESLRLRRAMELYLALAEVERSGRLRGEGPVDLVAAARAAVKEVEERFPSARVGVEAPAPTLHWRTDDVAVTRILSNLVENAVKYSPPEAPIRLLVHTTEGRVRLSVIDKCGGLSTPDMRRLFGRSVRGDHGRLGRGLGLGLYVSRRLSERVGGSLDVANEVDGCVFTLTLSDGWADQAPEEEAY